MKALALVLVSVSLFGTQSFAKEINPYFDFHLDSVEIVKSQEFTTYSTEVDFNPCQEVVSMSMLTDTVSLNKIINLGVKVYKFIEKNKPVVTTQSAYSTATPQGIRCWETLESWSAPESRTYRYSYKNGFGVTVVDFEFKLVFTYGGQLDGYGNYLTHVQMMPTKVDVAWGYTLDASAKILDPVNLGTVEDPIGGLEAQITWTIDTIVKHGEKTVPIFVDGLGRVKQL